MATMMGLLNSDSCDNAGATATMPESLKPLEPLASRQALETSRSDFWDIQRCHHGAISGIFSSMPYNHWPHYAGASYSSASLHVEKLQVQHAYAIYVGDGSSGTLFSY